MVLGGLLFIMMMQDGMFDKSSGDTRSVSKMNTTNSTNNTNKNMNIIDDVARLKIEDEIVGDGEEARVGDTVTVQYIGTLMDGTMFDASRSRGNDGFTFPLGRGQVIKGWDVGVVGMRVGGKRRLTIPSDLAYGNQAVGGVIPANSTLIFEVELVKVSR